MSESEDDELDKPMSMKEILEFYADTLKVLGTGNVTGIIAASAALHYFGARTAAIGWIKASATGFFLGAFFFALAYLLLALATMRFDDFIRGVTAAVRMHDVEAIRTPELSRSKSLSLIGINSANILAGISALCFFVGLILAFVALRTL